MDIEANQTLNFFDISIDHKKNARGLFSFMYNKCAAFNSMIYRELKK